MIEERYILSVIEDEAADWLVRRDAGLPPAQEEEFQFWLSADSRHGEAFARLRSALTRLDRPRVQGYEELVVRKVEGPKAVSARSTQSRRWVNVVGSLAACIALGLVIYSSQNRITTPVPEASALATIRLSPEVQRLPDGSLVQFNANSEIAVDYTPERRSIRLVRGEAHFAVMKNANRPFVVTAGNVEVRAVGTAFAVRLDSAQVDVLVTEGRVAVAQAPAPVSDPTAPVAPVPEPVYVSAGGRLEVPAEGLPAIQPTVQNVAPKVMDTELAWREARYEFTNTPFPAAIEIYNQKSRTKLVLGDPSLAGEQVSGIYWINDPEGFARLVENTHGLVATHEGDDRIVLRRRR